MTHKPDPVGHEWLEEFRRLFAEEFREPQCPATRAVEGVDHHKRKNVERYRRDNP